jgi:LPXTG-motif cell wall-anchored protein
MDGTALPEAGSTIASLLAIFLILGGAAFLLRRFRARLPGVAKLPGSINIVSSRPLGGQHTLVVAEVEGIKILIGVSRNGITTLARLGAND